MPENNQTFSRTINNTNISPVTRTVDFVLDYMQLSKKQKLNLTLNFSKIFAVTVMVFLRSRLGYRFTTPAKLIFMAILLAGFPYIAPNIPNSNVILHGEAIKPMPMLIFTSLMVIMGLYERSCRWTEFRQGKLWHSYSEGISIFSSFLPINESLCNRFIDPLICFISGYAIMITISAYLGSYLMFASLMLFCFEQALNESRIERLLDKLDGYCEAEASEKELAFHTRETGEASPQSTLSREYTAGIATGLAPDIEAHINRRRNRKPPPDDLA